MAVVMVMVDCGLVVGLVGLFGGGFCFPGRVVFQWWR